MTGIATTPAAGEAVTPAPTPSDEGPVDFGNPAASGAPTEAQNDTPPQGEPGSDAESRSEEKKRNRVPPSVRIAQITGKWKTSQAEAAEWKSKAEELERRLSNPPKPVSEMDFDEREEHRLDSVLTRREREQAQEKAAQREMEAHDSRVDLFMERMEEAKDRLPADTLEKFAKAEVTPLMAEMIIETEMTPEVVHHLNENPKLLKDLAALTGPKASQRDLMKAAAIFRDIERDVTPAQPRKVTTAPAPGTKLAGGQPPPAKTLEEEDDMAAYAARRKASWNKGGR